MSNTSVSNKTYSISVHYHENVVANYSNRKSKLFDTCPSEDFDSIIISLTERRVDSDGTISYRPREAQFYTVPNKSLNDMKLRSIHQKYALYIAEKTSDTRSNCDHYTYRRIHKIWKQICEEVLDYVYNGEIDGVYRPWSF